MAKRSKSSKKTRKSKSRGMLSWLPFFRGGADEASVTAPGLLLPKELYDAPAGVDAAKLPAFHATTAGGGKRKSRKSRKASRKSRKASRKSMLGGMGAALTDAYNMLLPAGLEAEAGISPEWDAAQSPELQDAASDAVAAHKLTAATTGGKRKGGRKSRKASRKGSRKGSRKASRKGSRKGSRKASRKGSRK